MAEMNGSKVSALRKVWRGLKSIYLIEPDHFSDKQTINFKALIATGICLGIVFLFFVLAVMPNNPPTGSFNTKADGQTQTAPVSTRTGGSFSDSMGGGGGTTAPTTSTRNRNTAMVLSRPGDTSNQVPPGTKFFVQLADQATISSQAQPIIGIISKDVTTDLGLAIPKGAKIFGQASFDKETKRASVQWKTVLLTDGRSKPISAIALGFDSQPGMDGDVHSDAVKNTVGSFLTRFVAGTADGAITRNFMGQSTGGLQNGLLNGVSETAKERADLWSEDLKKERAWIELKKGQESQAILTDGFIFLEPGGVN